METTIGTNSWNYFNRLTCTLFLVLGLLGLMASASYAAKPVTTVSPVSSLAAKAVSQDQVGLTWAHADASKISGYSIERSLNSTSSFQIIATAAPLDTSLADAPLADGKSYYYRMRAFTKSGKTTTYSSYSPIATATTPVADTADTTAPTVSITSPASATTYLSAQTVTISASASDNVGVSRVEFYIGATLLKNDTTSPYFVDWAISSANNGSHTLTAKAYDAAGNSTVSSVTVTVNIAVQDLSAPSVALTSPTAGTTFTSAQTVTIAANASDNVGVSRVEFYNGATLLKNDTTSPYFVDWAISSANNGSHTLTAKAYDAADNSKVSSATTVTVNIPVAAPGAFTFSAATYSVSEGADKVNITINRVGGSAGIATIDWKTQGVTATFAKDYGNFDWTTLTFADGETSKTQSITIVDDTLVEGNETFNVLISNPIGGATLGSITTTAVTIVDNDTVTADTTAPTVSITSPANATTFTTDQTVTIAATASDNIGVSRVEFYIGATLLKNDTTSPYFVDWAISSANNGSHTLTAKAYDAAGNSKVSSAITVTVNIDTAVVSSPIISGPVKVFPGAEGFGTNSVAGRGGQIIKVTNLNDSGTGSLRAAITTAGARIIVFEVGGHIKLQSDLTISQPYVTIAGQTAPFPGIQISGGRITIQTHNVLMQHIRSRYGDYSGTNETHAMRIISGAYNVVVDHCTFMWADDEVASIWTNDKSMYDITLSNSIVAEGLGSHGYGTIVGAKYAPSPGPNWVNRISLVKNLYAHNHERSPSLSRDVNAVVINNLSYNAQWEFVALGLNNGPTTASIIGNHFITGSANYGGAAIGVAATGVGSKIYQSDNRVTGPYSRSVFSDGTGNSVVSQPPLVDSTTILPGSTVKDYVLRNVGARPAYRDSAELRVIDEVRNGTGFHKNNIAEAGGWPSEYNTMTSRSLSSLLPANPSADDDGNGYTNIEEVLYKMAAEVEGRL